jgi:hypothetical protein
VDFDRGVLQILDTGLIKAFVPDSTAELPSNGSLIEDNCSIGKQMLLECPSSLTPNRFSRSLRSSKFNDFQTFLKLVNTASEIPWP